MTQSHSDTYTVHMASNLDGALPAQTKRLLARGLAEKGDVALRWSPEAAGADLVLRVGPGPGPEGYTISEADGAVVIAGADARGLLYGVGRFLHSSEYGVAGWRPSTWRGSSAPDCRMRGIYIANNFNNWHCSAPVADFQRYLDDLALWGMNSVAFNFQMLASVPESERAARLARNRALVAHAISVGMRVGLLYAPNHGYGPLPEAVQAAPFPDSEPPRRGGGDNPAHFVCPSKPAGMALIRERMAADLDGYRGLDIDFVATFPYDAGGCGCDDCWPWGARGFVELSREVIGMARERFPSCRLVLCTWCYDVREESDGEYAGLARALQADNHWCDMIMTDAHGDFPRYPLEHGVPGGLPMINFAEISMWGRYPWGGSGANPFPHRLTTVWRQASELLDGGLPYSEGRFEDINKVTCLSLFWDKAAEADAIVAAYAQAEFGAAVVDPVVEAVALLEANYPTADMDLGRAERALALLQAAEAQMHPSVRRAWRWRILLLRAVIDVETLRHPDVVSAARADAYEELTTLYCAQQAGPPVAPRAPSFYARPDIDYAGPQFAAHIGEQSSDPNQIQ